MDAGAASDRPRPEEGEVKARTQESQDDGYETSNSGDAARRKAGTPEPPAAPAALPLDAPAPLDMSAVKCASDQDDSAKSEAPDKEKMEEGDAESRSLSNSPKRMSVALNPEDSHSNLSAEASNSQSNSSMTMRATQPGYEVENLNTRLLPQEDSSSQPHDRYTQMRNLQNPFDLNKGLQPQFLRGQDPLNFGSIKREYDMPETHDMYNQYRRDEQYPRELYPKYNKRPEEMYNSNMAYNFGMKREMENPYDMQQGQQMYGGIKREQEEMMYNGVKRECVDDPYSFVDEDAMCAMLGGQNAPSQHNAGMMGQVMHHMGHPEGIMGMGMPNQMIVNQPKKRGRKKKIKDENGMEIKQEPGMDGIILPVKPVKERKKHDRFNGMSEEEVSRRTLPDHLAENLDIIIIGINPGLFAAYKGHHYAGPGNHFWKCLYLSGLTREQMSADEDYKLLNFGVGFTNMVARATKGSADLTRREIKEGSTILLEKLQTFRPKIAVFNGKLIYEVFSGKKDFCFGKQPDTIHGTNTYMWVMPSSSARCAQLPRAADKVPFYAALKKFRDYLNGAIHHIDESELIFPDTTCRRPHEEIEIRRLTMDSEQCDTMILEDGTEVPLKKKRGRPKKIKLENGEVVPPTPRAPRQPRAQASLDNGEQPPKKKRGRPKKIRPEEQQFLLQQQQQQQQQQQSQAMMATQLPPLPSMNPQQSLDNQYGMHQNTEFPGQGMNEPMNQNNMMYQGGMGPNQNMGQGPNMGGNQASSPYYQTGPVTMPQGPSSASQMDSGPLDMGPNVSAGPTGTAGPMGQMQRPQGYSQSPGPYSQSPRPQGMGYSQSPRPQGYAQSPQRHQSVTPSYNNSPAPRPTGTPQPTPPVHSPFPPSPAQQNPNTGAPFSQTSPQRPQSQNHSYSSPVRNPYSRSPIPQNNTPTYAQPQQSPMYAQSPVNSGPGQGYSQLSPASQSVGGYASQSPAPNRFSQSPAPLGHPYSRSPAPQGLGQNYSQSPGPQSTPFPQHSPAMGGGGQSYTPSPAHTPYSQHNSPAASTQGRGQGYNNSPVPHHFGAPSPLHPSQTRQGSMPFSQSPQNDSANVQRQEYGTDLSSEISAAISSPPPVSPGMGHIDFEPPIATNKIRVPENETMGSQENSPLGSTDMHAGSNSNSSLSDFNKSSTVSDNQNYDGHSQSISSQNPHSALNLIGPPSSTPSDISSPIPASMESMANLNSMRNTPTYGNPMYGETMNAQHSPLQHEQRLGFQVPTPTGAASSPYGQGAGLNLGASPSPKGSHDGNGSAHHERLANTYGYQGDQGGNGLSSSPRLSEPGANMMPAHQLHQHPIYSNPFNRSTPPHSLPTVGSGQPSPFSPPAPAFRPPSETAPTGSPGEYSGAPKTKSQDVASKSLSGLESLVDQIPSIAEGGAAEALPSHPAPPPPLPDPYAGHAPSIYSPYTAYPSPAYGAPNNTYPSPLTAGSFVGYPGNPYGQLMRPTPGYLPEALSYHHHPHPGPYPPQYGGTGTGYGGPPPPHNYSPYYNGYAPPSAIQNPANMPTYLTSHVLDHIHKNAAADAASSVSFGSFC